MENVGLVKYLENRISIYKNIRDQEIFRNELEMRNYNNIRKMYSELVCVLALSRRKHSIENVKINRKEEFEIKKMTERLRASSTEYTEGIFRKKDSAEVYIAINELGYHIKESKEVRMGWYWIEWIIEFDIYCKREKGRCECENRDYKVESKYKNDIIWLIWDSLLKRSREIGNEYIEKTMEGLLEIFSIKYTTGCIKRRRYILYYGVMLVIEEIPSKIEIIEEENKKILEKVVENIDEIYKQIKKNEKKPNTEYLFNSLNESKSNYEEMVKKMDKINEMLW